jgi:hypothetical protein
MASNPSWVFGPRRFYGRRRVFNQPADKASRNRIGSNPRRGTASDPCRSRPNRGLAASCGRHSDAKDAGAAYGDSSQSSGSDPRYRSAGTPRRTTSYPGYRGAGRPSACTRFTHSANHTKTTAAAPSGATAASIRPSQVLTPDQRRAASFHRVSAIIL